MDELAPSRAGRFRYASFTVDRASNRVIGEYQLDSWTFREEFHFPGGGAWADPVVEHAVRLLYLLAGVSYYKAGAPPVIDLGSTPVTSAERAFLREYYLSGLGEFAYRAGLDLSDLRLEGGTDFVPVPGRRTSRGGGLSIPFGGGLDSIVTVELLRSKGALRQAQLFVVNRPGDRFEAIEVPAAATGLPVARAERVLDPQVLRSSELGFLNGHVPVTAIISVMAIVDAALRGRDAVVMSNEWSSSAATLVTPDGHHVNHQYSKSLEFETAFRSILTVGGGPEYFSLLRPWSELWIARRFATDSAAYLPLFRSCNRAFHVDPRIRWKTWCGQCDKCAFIDLILAPFVPAPELAAVFAGREPLQDEEQESRFHQLLGFTPDAKPWECVGDVRESRVAARLAADRPDRRGEPMLARLAQRAAAYDDPSVQSLMHPMSEHHIPDRYATDELG